MTLNDPIGHLRMVGPTYAKRLEKLKIFTIEDLLFHFPFRYDDFSIVSPIARVQIGETVTIAGQVEKIENSYTKTGKKIQTATISDNTAKIEAIWFNQPFLLKTIKIGETYNFAGKVEWFGHKKVLFSPEYEFFTPTSHNSTCLPSGMAHNSLPTLTQIHTGRLVPIYPETYGISSKWLRSRIKTVLDIFGNQIEEFLPQNIIQQEKLLSETEAIKQIHFPQNKVSTNTARYRLAFDELFLIQLAGALRKKEWQSTGLAPIINNADQKISDFLQNLPFELTGAQKRCVEEILHDMMGRNIPMNRLLEGDVGCGKTVVAAAAAYAAFLSDFQTLYMAPTEILANQHFTTFKSLLTPLGVPIELITGSNKPKIQNSKFWNNYWNSRAFISGFSRGKSGFGDY